MDYDATFMNTAHLNEFLTKQSASGWTVRALLPGRYSTYPAAVIDGDSDPGGAELEVVYVVLERESLDALAVPLRGALATLALDGVQHTPFVYETVQVPGLMLHRLQIDLSLPPDWVPHADTLRDLVGAYVDGLLARPPPEL